MGELGHTGIFFLLLFWMLPFNTMAQNPDYENAEELGQSTQNPLADLTVIPFQNNFSFDNTQNRETGYILNIQPIFPLQLKSFKFVNRLTFGLGYMPGITAGSAEIPLGFADDGQTDGTWGALDLNWTGWITPKPIGDFSWGIGPSVTFPIASDNRLGSGKWSLGASAVFVWQPKKWTIDAIFRQLWSVGGSEDRTDVNQLLAQPLIAYNIKDGWAVATMPVITVNWDFPEDQKALVPFGGGVNKLLFLGKIPMLVMCHYYYNAIRPELAASSEFRLQLTFILAK